MTEQSNLPPAGDMTQHLVASPQDIVGEWQAIQHHAHMCLTVYNHLAAQLRSEGLSQSAKDRILGLGAHFGVFGREDESWSDYINKMDAVLKFHATPLGGCPGSC